MKLHEVNLIVKKLFRHWKEGIFDTAIWSLCTLMVGAVIGAIAILVHTLTGSIGLGLFIALIFTFGLPILFGMRNQ